MKKKLMLMLAFLIVSGFWLQTAYAQITISFPRIQIPKFKKEKPQTTRPESATQKGATSGEQASATAESKDNETNDGNQTAAKQDDDKCAENGWMILVLDDLMQIKEDFEKYTGSGYLYTKTPTYDYLLFSVSPRARQNWLKSVDRVEEGNCPNLVSAFNKMSAAAAKVLPLLAPRKNEYMIQNPATENLLKSRIRNVSTLKIFHAGVKQANWLIEKNSLGIPTARYKHGMIWARNPADDHPYCHAYYINIVQDYAGGGTFGASYANFVQDNIVPCPAGTN